jgi:hypothetical protein
MSAMQPDIWAYRYDTWSSSAIDGYDVHAIDGSIGSVDGATAGVDPRCVVVHTGAWIFGKRVLLPVGVIEDVDDQQRSVRVALTKEQIKQAPELDETSLDDDETRSRLGEYYGRFFLNAP